MARTRLHVHLLYRGVNMYTRMEQSYGVEILCVLYVFSSTCPILLPSGFIGFERECDLSTFRPYMMQTSRELLMRDRRRHLRKSSVLCVVPLCTRSLLNMRGNRWANQICADDDQERAIVLASMKYVFSLAFSTPTLLHTTNITNASMWNNVINAWWPLVFYPATDAPRFKKGMIAMLAVAAATLVVTWLVWYLERREKMIAALNSREVEGEMRSADGSREGSMVIVGERELHDGPQLEDRGELEGRMRYRGKDEKNGDSVGGQEKQDIEDVKEKELEDTDA